MLDQFLQYIKKENLFAPSKKILLTISGGIDSVVMAHLFAESGTEFGIAHCNFQLRDHESDEDEIFVKKLAEKLHVEFFVKRFDTTAFANEHGISIQMAARDLRYDWFEEIRRKNEYDFIATAHHQDDRIETFFINLSRGSGLRGLRGMLPKNDKIIRPLFVFTRKEIEAYAGSNNIIFREDSSNQEQKYLRNQIRHEIIPAFKKRNLAFHDEMIQTLDRLRETEEIYSEIILQKKKELLIKKGETYSISINELLKISPLNTWLFELLRDFDFNFASCLSIAQSLKGISGKEFFSATHRLIKDREKLIIIPLQKNELRDEYLIDANVMEITAPIHLTFNRIEITADFKIPADPNIACLNVTKITFPLKLRKWKHGDIFYPLGMDKPKKLSDYFIDNKFSINKKEDAWLLCSGDDIVWIVGHRIDDRYKVISSTMELLTVCRLP